MAVKRNISDYKDRMSAPIGAILVDRNGKPIGKKKTTKKSKKR